MAKKIRFPLVMADGAEARSLDELREHFDLESVLTYFQSGKLLVWLRDRYYTEETEALCLLDGSAPDFQERLCATLGVEYVGSVDLEELTRRQERLAKLRDYTDEPEFIDHIDQVAFDQEELATLLDEGSKTIYLCAGRFILPATRTNVQYIGISHPTVFLSGLKEGETLSADIVFTDVEIENPPVQKPREIDFTAAVKGVFLSATARQGFRTIQVELEDVAIIDGVRYDHIPILSADLFDKLELCEGDLVRVHRVGDVIPSITVEERNGGKKIELPVNCPICSAKLVREAKKLKCNCVTCKANRAGRILNFMEFAGIKGIGEAVAMDMVNAGIYDIKHILEDNPKQFEKIGWSEKRAKMFQDELKTAVSEMRDYELLAAIGVPGIGIETAKKLMYENMVPELRRRRYTNPGPISFATEDDAISCRTRSILECLFKYIKRRSTREDFENMKTVGHTGGDPSKETRKLIRDLGWDLVDGKEFDYLIVPSHDYFDELVELAQNNGIPLYSEAEFCSRFSS